MNPSRKEVSGSLSSEIRNIITTQAYLDVSYELWQHLADLLVDHLVAAVYHCGVWDKDYRTRFPELKKKPVSKMDEAEIYAYLTMIICTERTQDGCIDAHILNGKLLALVKRWLELELEVSE